MQEEKRFSKKITPYLRDLAKKSDAIKAMYFFDPESEDIAADTERDLLNEKTNAPLFGSVRKFDGRLLALLSTRVLRTVGTANTRIVSGLVWTR